jgi:hypothetical protein
VVAVELETLGATITARSEHEGRHTSNDESSRRDEPERCSPLAKLQLLDRVPVERSRWTWHDLNTGSV